MTRSALPIGIQTFREIREGDFYYVDKTGFALRLIEEGTHYFLSRPRRFGKSLFLDTLAELFEGNAALFAGLQAEPRWDWSRRFPVIRLSFAEGVLASRQALDRRIEDLLRINRDTLGVSLYPDLDIPGQFGELIRQAHAHSGERVVVLVDEYDKPILDNLTRPEPARAIRDGLHPRALLTGEDICSQQGPMVSPKFLRREYFPLLEYVWEPLRDVGAKLVWHCDGDYRPLLDDVLAFIQEAGLLHIEEVPLSASHVKGYLHRVRLTEAQLEPFMFNVLIDYPSYEDEVSIVASTTGAGQSPKAK